MTKKKRTRKASKSKKGGQFERDISRDLSDWWTAGARDDVFWRSQTSGGRATQRAKKGKSTAGHCGDIAATDPCAMPLIDLITIEAKAGYSTKDIFSLADRAADTPHLHWEKFIQQAVEAHERSGSFSWMIVCKRTKRQVMVVLPRELVELLNIRHEFFCPCVRFKALVRFKQPDKKKVQYYRAYHAELTIVSWKSWLNAVDPTMVRTVAKRA